MQIRDGIARLGLSEGNYDRMRRVLPFVSKHEARSVPIWRAEMHRETEKSAANLLVRDMVGSH